MGWFRTVDDKTVAQWRGELCTPTIYVDGVRIPLSEGPIDLSHYVEATAIRAVEMYDGFWATPGCGLSTLSNCPVLVIWTSFGFGDI